jgi:TDG/mug DNA glycosylase family protein
MGNIVSFSQVSNGSARALVLGSMPSVRSLEANQYYAHPRNTFWRITASIFGFDATSPYEIRLEALKISGVALWDVLHACIRPGSLDSAIEAGSRVPNDFQSFFEQHRGIELICFNGAEAEKSYHKYVLPELNINSLKYVRLPSTSPAHAALSFEKKSAMWRNALGFLANQK